MSSSTAVPAALILVTTGALGVGAATQVGEMPTGLENHLDRLLEDTVRDLTVNWLDVTAANGVVENDTITGAELLVRLDGGAEVVDLDRTVVLAPDGTELGIANASAVRDEDGSMGDDRMTRDDLASIEIPFATPVGEREERTLLFQEPGKAKLEIGLQAPRSIQGEHPPLDVYRSY